MFRFSARDAHAWHDIAQNIGKLSLAGLFAAGTLLLAHAYAEPASASPIIAKSIPMNASSPFIRP